MRRTFSTFVALGLASGCSPSLDLPDGGFSVLPDRQITLPPAAPSVAPVPAVTPYQIVTFRGSSEGRRVFITANGLNPQAVLVGSGGDFCADVRVRNPGTYQFDLQAYSQDNQLGDPLPQKISVTYDPTAPEVDGLLTCTGVHPRGCEDTVEICNDNRDNDCDNLVDQQDPECNPCVDDDLEENDDLLAPSIPPGQYTGLQICAEDPDYYGVYVRQGEKIDAQILFTHAEGNLTLDLLSVNFGTEQAPERMVLVRADSLDDNEALSYTATVTGYHMLAVYGDQNTQNEYRMVLSLSDN